MNTTFGPTTELHPLFPSIDAIKRLGQHWGWILATGVVYVVLGALAFSMPAASTFGLTVTLACLLIVSGAAHFVQAIRLRREVGAGTRFLLAIFSMLVGGLMLRWPDGGMLSIALLLSFYFLISAATQWILFSAIKPIGVYGWGLVSSFMTFLLGVYIIATFPFSAIWVPGALLGIDLVFGGATMIGFAFALRRAHRQSIGFRPQKSAA